MPCGVRVDVSHVMLCYPVFAYISLRLYTPASTCGVSGNRVSRVWGKWCRFERVGVKVIASKAAVLVTGPKQGAASADPALLHLYPPPFRSHPSQAPLRSLPVHAVPDLLQPLQPPPLPSIRSSIGSLSEATIRSYELSTLPCLSTR